MRNEVNPAMNNLKTSKKEGDIIGANVAPIDTSYKYY
jgi:hypothetical protein